MMWSRQILEPLHKNCEQDLQEVSHIQVLIVWGGGVGNKASLLISSFSPCIQIFLSHPLKVYIWGLMCLWRWKEGIRLHGEMLQMCNPTWFKASFFFFLNGRAINMSSLANTAWVHCLFLTQWFVESNIEGTLEFERRSSFKRFSL